MTEKIEQAKKEFLEKYKTQKDETQKAISNSIKAALQHNKIYHDKNLANNIKTKVKKPWEDYLLNLSKTINDKKSETEYLEKILELKEKLKESFDKQRIPSNLIKICHAQKSISVYLKYLWCMGGFKPLHCPVDSIILKKINWRGENWTSVDNINNHVEMIEAIRLFVQKDSPELSIAEWELLNF